jgi:hypothetical protein
MMNFFRELANLLKKDTDLTGRIALIIGITAVLALAIFLSGPKPTYEETLTPTPVPTDIRTISGTNTVEFPFDRPVSEYAQTTGVAVGVVAVVAILLLGTALELVRDKAKRRSGK